MSKKKITLEEAKEILKSDKVFFNGNNKFNVLDIGKYSSGITIEIPQEWNLNENRKPENPINYISSKQLTDGMNIDFDGEASILLGKYRLSKNGKPVFELTKPTEATDTLIKIGWGGAFNSTRGQSREYAKETGATFFTRRSSNGGGVGRDYWILPVTFVKDMEPRDVSAILSNIEQAENDRISEIDQYLEKKDLELKNSIQNRDIVLNKITPIIESIKTYNSNFEYKANQDAFIYKETTTGFERKEKYSDELIEKISNILVKLKNEKELRDTYQPMFKEVEDALKVFESSIKYYDTYVAVSTPNRSFPENYRYSSEGYTSFISFMTEYREKAEKAIAEARIKALKLKEAAELKIKKDNAKKMNYPENFEFWNRLDGATGISHAYVIESDGTIREPDYNNLRNLNHMHHTPEWKKYCDGTQGYEQLLPGEIIVSYTKNCTAEPYIFDVEWADSEITKPQLETICNELSDFATFAETSCGEKITDIKTWITTAIKDKMLECKKQLNIPEKNDSFIAEIADLAKKKSDLTQKNTQAINLVKKYEEQYEEKSNQQNLEDN